MNDSKKERGESSAAYSAAQSAAKVAKIGNVEYPTLAAAIAALTGAGETIELLSDYTAADDENLVFAKDAILDLGEFELTLPAALLGAKAFEVSDGASLVLTNGVITMGDKEYGLQVYGTAIVADGCTMTKLVNTKVGPIFDIYGKGTTSTDGGTVLVEAGAYIESGADVFRHKKNGAGVAAQANIYVTGGTLKAPVTGNYCIFNGSSYLSADDVAVITGGTFLGKFEQTEKWGGMTLLGADAADARFDDTAIVTATARLATGYEFAEAEEDGLWKVVKSPVAEIVGGDKYATLGEAIAALTGDETIKLLSDYTAADAEDLTFTKSATLDLGGFTLTIPTQVAQDGKYGVAAGAEVTFTDGTVDTLGGVYNLKILGKATIDCTMKIGVGAGSLPLMNIYGGTVIVTENAVLESCWDVFRTEDDGLTSTIVINGGSITAAKGQTAAGDSGGVFYHYKNHTLNLTINDGIIDGGSKGVFCILNNAPMNCTLDDSCKAKFANTTRLTAFIAPGYELVKGTDEYYTIAKIPSFTVTFTQNNEPIAGSTTNVLRDTALTAEMIPAVSGGTWDVNPLNAVITCNTNFNYTVAVGPEWPEDWPADVPTEMKEAFATWAEGKGELDFNQKAVQDAFLMNTEVGAVPELKIESISVEGTTATIVVSATGKDLENGINGVLYIDAANDLTNWTTTEVETNADFTDGKATFTVDAAKFMKAGVGFKAPVVE